MKAWLDLAKARRAREMLHALHINTVAARGSPKVLRERAKALTKEAN